MAESKFAHLPISLSPDADLKKQLCEVPGTKRPGQTGAHVRLHSTILDL